MMSVAISKGLHKEITSRWRKVIPYSTNYNEISKKKLEQAIKTVYKDMPALKKYALKYLKEVWK